MESPTPTNSKPQALDLLAQITAAITKNQPGVQATEFYVTAFAILIVFVLVAIGKLPTAWAGVAGIVVPAGYQFLRNTRKDDRESSLLSLIDTLGNSAPNLAPLLAPPILALPPIPTTSIPKTETEPKATAVSGSSATPSPATADEPSIAVSGTAGGFVEIRTLGLLAVVAGFAFFLLVYLTGCGTPFGNGVADVLQSPANQMIVAAASQAAVVSLESSIGGKVPPTMEAPITTAAGAVVNGVAWTGIYSIGQALRTKQGATAANGSPISASPGVLTATIINQAGITPATAQIVATSVSTIAQQGIPPDIANEAVARLMDAAAAAKAPGAKQIVPLQSSLSRPHFRETRLALRTLCSASDDPISPVVVTHLTGN